MRMHLRWTGNFFLPVFFFGIFIFTNSFAVQIAASAAKLNTLEKIRVADYADFSRITLEFSQAVHTTSSVTTDKNRILVHLSGVSRGAYRSSETYNSPAFDRILLNTNGAKNHLTIAIPVSANVDLKRLHWDSWTDLITIDIPLIKPNYSLIPSQATLDWAKKNGMKVIVIDPGHGGFNTNATGSRYCRAPHLYESEVVLDVGLRLFERLKKDPRYLPVMTRYGDYLPAKFGVTGTNRADFQRHALYHRVAFAQEMQGDLFISLHCNAPGSNTSPLKPRGFEIYYYGSDHASYVLRNHRYYKDRLPSMGINPYNRSQTQAKISALTPKNVDLALLISNEVKQANLGIPLRPRTQVSKRFVVINHLNMPSVLAEMAFLSHPQDHELMRKDSTRDGFALAFHNAMNDFFFKDVSDLDQLLIALKTSPALNAETDTQTLAEEDTGSIQPDILALAELEDDVEDSVDLNILQSQIKSELDFPSVLARQISEEYQSRSSAASAPSPAFHTVQKNETLGKIASRYGTDGDVLKQLNPAIGTRDTIYPGQKIQLPVDSKPASDHPLSNLPTLSSADQTALSQEQTYSVRRNDTLEGIAILYDTTVQEIKAYNNKKNNTIYPGDEIKIPPTASAMMTYYVKPGDTIGKIAKRYKVPEFEIKQLNNLRTSLIYPGDKIQVRLPGPGTNHQFAETQPQFRDYKVRYGDSLWKIANQFQSTVNSIKQANGLHNNSLKPGMTLRIPLQ